MPLDCSSINSLYIGEERHPLCHEVPNTVQMKSGFAYFISKRKKREAPSLGSTDFGMDQTTAMGLLPWQAGQPLLTGHTFCIFHFLLEFISLALLSRYLAWHPAAKRGCLRSWGVTPRLPAGGGSPGKPRCTGSSLGAAVANLNSHLCSLFFIKNKRDALRKPGHSSCEVGACPRVCVLDFHRQPRGSSLRGQGPRAAAGRLLRRGALARACL